MGGMPPMGGSVDPPRGFRRSLPGQARVRSVGVVIGDPPAEASPELRVGLEGVEIGAFIFQRPPEPLNEDIVHPAAPAIHADAHVGLPQDRGEGEAGRSEEHTSELQSLMRISYAVFCLKKKKKQKITSPGTPQ